jgi:hypothetical protein
VPVVDVDKKSDSEESTSSSSSTSSDHDPVDGRRVEATDELAASVGADASAGGGVRFGTWLSEHFNSSGDQANIRAHAQAASRTTESESSPTFGGGQRGDGPALLDLEKINMSEEELIKSYDPDNEENNYHLPNHIFKRLRMDKYREACSEVVPNSLYISGYKVPCDRESLRRNQITHIVNMAADVCDNSFPGEFKYLTFYLKDANYEDLSSIFYRTIEWMENAITAGGRVLVHCREGVSRSATMVLAYTMWKFQIQFDDAFKSLQKIRPVCNPNTGFTCQLLTLGKKLSRANAISSGPSPGVPAPINANLPLLFRVAPHHPKEPFLMLQRVDSTASRPLLDPRFGWVVQRDSDMILWVGPQVPDKWSVENAIRQHAQWLAVFEGVKRTLEMAAEPLRMWQALKLEDSSADLQGCLVGVRESLDTEFGILQQCSSTSSVECK